MYSDENFNKSFLSLERWLVYFFRGFDVVGLANYIKLGSYKI